MPWGVFRTRHGLPRGGRFRYATLVSGELWLEIGSAFLQILDILAPRNALELIHHLRVICPYKLRAAHALHVEERQLCTLDAAGQSIVTGGHLFGTGEDRTGLFGEALGEERRVHWVANPAWRRRHLRGVLGSHPLQQRLVFLQRRGRLAEVTLNEIERQRLFIPREVPAELGGYPRLELVALSRSLITALKHDAFRVVLNPKTDVGHHDIQVRHRSQVMAEVDVVVPNVDSVVDGAPSADQLGGVALFGWCEGGRPCPHHIVAQPDRHVLARAHGRSEE